MNTRCLLLLLALSAHHLLLAQQHHFFQWEVGYHKTLHELPAKWVPATVPGAVQLDIMKAEQYKQPYWYGNNVEQFTWMESSWFTYRTVFNKPVIKPGQRVYFFSKGIDYRFIIYLNGEKIHEQEGMFTYVDIDITNKLKAKNELAITLFPVPMVPGSRTDASNFRDNARKSVKPAVSYGWDWHPRLITRGIWDDTYLAVRNPSHLTSTWIDYTLNADRTNANLRAELEGVSLKGASYHWTMTSPDGRQVLDKKGILSSETPEVRASLENIKLWWPNGYGKPELYSSKITIIKNGLVSDSGESRVGFKTVKLIMNEGEWAMSRPFPLSRNNAAAQFEVNGKPIFAKGSNWVHPEIFMGLATKETYEKHIRLAKEANMNIFRVWGGGVTNKESFFDLCDEYGILVWQEFPLACNLYPDEEPYLKILEQEARSIIKHVRPHACLALWCGGNELFNSWSRMTEQSLPLRLLNQLCLQLNPQIPFNYTSPLNGMAHGHYVFWDPANGGEVFQWMPKANNTAYTEFGIPGVANLDVLKSMMPEEEWFPPKPGTSWEKHHAFGVWGKDRWLEYPFLQDYFGEIKNLEDLVAYSQLTQSEGYKCIFEEARRQKPYCAMAINWDFQEPWPCAANNSLINYPCEPKPAYYQVAQSLRPVLASARVPKFRWETGETFTCKLYLLNDSFEKIPPGKMTAKLQYDGTETTFSTWNYEGAGENRNAAGPTASVVIPDMKTNLFKLVLEVEGQPAYRSSYTFICKGKPVLDAKATRAFLQTGE